MKKFQINLLIFALFGINFLFSASQGTTNNKYYNENLAPSDKTIINLFAPHTGLNKRPQEQWNTIETNKDKICSTDICPKDKQISCYRGIPGDVNGCQDSQRERLSNFAEKYLKGTWIKDGIPGTGTGAGAGNGSPATVNTQKLQDPSKKPGIPSIKNPSQQNGTGTNINAPLNSGTGIQGTTSQDQTNGITNNNNGSLNAGLGVAAGTAGVIALSTLGQDGKNTNGTTNNSTGDGNSTNGLNSLVPSGQQTNPSITPMQPGQPSVNDPQQKDDEPKKPTTEQPAVQASQKCTVEWAKEVGVTMENTLSILQTQLLTMQKQLLSPIVVPNGADPKQYQAAEKVKRALQINVVKRNMERLKLLKQLFIDQLNVVRTSTDANYQKSHLFLSKEQFKLYSPKDKSSFPVNAVKIIDTFNTCAMDKKTTKEINDLINGLLLSMKQQGEVLKQQAQGG